jgi:hypothetical protein
MYGFGGCLMMVEQLLRLFCCYACTAWYSRMYGFGGCLMTAEQYFGKPKWLTLDSCNICADKKILVMNKTKWCRIL